MKQFYLVACLAGSSALVVMAGCERSAGVKVTPSDTVAPVSQPVQRKVRDFVDYTGRTNAKNSVVIQPRVTGYLVADDAKDKDKVAFFKEGDFVQKNQVL